MLKTQGISCIMHTESKWVENDQPCSEWLATEGQDITQKTGVGTECKIVRIVPRRVPCQQRGGLMEVFIPGSDKIRCVLQQDNLTMWRLNWNVGKIGWPAESDRSWVCL